MTCRSKIRSAAILILMVMPACGEVDDDAGTVSAGDAPESVAKEACLTYFACECDQITGEFLSRDACELEVSATVQRAVDEGEQAGLTYNGECFAGVEAFYATLGCLSIADLLYAAGVAVAVEESDDCKPFHGDRREGESCTSLSITDGDDCLAELKCENGVCAKKESATLRREGEACGNNEQCRAGLACVAVQLNGEQACHELPGPGKTCLGVLDLCDSSAYCDQVVKKCASLPGAGKPCAPSPSYLMARCDPHSVCESDTCQPAPGLGEACAGKCDAGLYCTGGTCQEAQPIACIVTAVIGF
jgi:hypothetical protein